LMCISVSFIFMNIMFEVKTQMAMVKNKSNNKMTKKNNAIPQKMLFI